MHRRNVEIWLLLKKHFNYYIVENFIDSSAMALSGAAFYSGPDFQSVYIY